MPVDPYVPPSAWTEASPKRADALVNHVGAEAQRMANQAEALAAATTVAAVADKVATTDPRLSDARVPTAHQHPQSDVTGLTAALAGKSAVGHTHTSANVSDFTEAVQDVVGGFFGVVGGSVAYDDAANTLTVTIPPGSGTDPEVVRDTIGAALIGVGAIQVSINDAADTISISTTATQNATDNALRDRSTHTGTQAISTVSGLQVALDGKAPSSHSHAIADVTSLQTALDGKAAATHGHVIGDVSGLTGALADKQSVTIYDAKGDILVGSADNAAVRVPVGSDGQVMTADSSQPSGVKWSTPAAGGGGGSTSVIAKRLTDYTVSASTSLATVLTLPLTGAAGSMWRLAALIRVGGNPTMDVKWQFAYPAGMTLDVGVQGGGGGGAFQMGAVSANTQPSGTEGGLAGPATAPQYGGARESGLPGTGGATMLSYLGIIVATATLSGAAVEFKVAQNTSDAANLTVFTGSHLMAVPL